MTSVAARRVAVRVDGVVQGVGFRPSVFRLAEEHGMAGFVRNDSHGVELEVEGAPADVERFLAALPARTPPLARIEELRVRDVAALGQRGFAITPSARLGKRRRARLSRQRHMRSLPDGAVRSGRPPPPLSVPQLHRLRPAFHDRHRRPLRPAGDDDGGVRDVRRLPRGVRGSARSPFPRPAQRLPAVRAARDARRPRGRGVRRRGRRRRRAAAARSDRRRQGHRRLPPGVPRR